MGNWNQSNASGDPSEESTVDFSGGRTSSTSTSTSTDNGNDNNDFFSGTFDDPGEPGFSGPSYAGQTGYDSDGDFWSAADVGAPTDDYIPGWSVLGYPGPSYDPPQDPFDLVSNYFGNALSLGLPSGDGDSDPFGDLAPPTPGGGGLPTSYETPSGVPVTDYSMTPEMAQVGYRTVGFQGLMAPPLKGPRSALDFPEEYYTSTFLSREKKRRSTTRMTDVEAQAYADYLGLSVEIERRPEPSGNIVERALETVARSFSDQISARFGSPAATPYVGGLQEGFLGKVTDDYALTDFIANLIGMKVPGGAEVDTALAEDITGRGMGERISQIATSMFGDTSVIGTPEQIEQMWADARAEADAERARGGSEPTVTTSINPAAAALARPRSRLLRSFLGVAGPRIYPLFYREGGVVQKKAIGGETLDQQMQGAMAPPASGDGPVGFVGDRPENLSEAKTVADDVPLDVEEGTFILNAAAVEFAGSEDIKNMILGAIYEARAQGVDISGDENKIERERAVSLLVSEGEVVIPPLLAKIIGYDKLNKINNRGKQEVEKRVEENGQSPEAEALDKQPANPSEGAAMSEGGFTGILDTVASFGAGLVGLGDAYEIKQEAGKYAKQAAEREGTNALENKFDAIRHIGGTMALYNKYPEIVASSLLTVNEFLGEGGASQQMDETNNAVALELYKTIPSDKRSKMSTSDFMAYAETFVNQYEQDVEAGRDVPKERQPTLSSRPQQKKVKKKIQLYIIGPEGTWVPNPQHPDYEKMTKKMAPGGFVSAQGQGSTGENKTGSYKQANLSTEYEGDGFVLKPRVNYDERTNTQEYPDGVVVNEKGKSIGFAMDGQMFLSDDKSLRAGFERQATNTEGRVNLPEQYGGETIEFGGGSKMKRYNMGATFGPLDVDISKTQLPGGDSVMGGSARYRFSENGDVTLEAMDDGRSGRVALNYRF